MKKITKLTGIIVFAALIGLSMSACDDLSGDKAKDGDITDGGSGGTTFNSIQAFHEWLDKQPDNTPDNPYRVKLNIKPPDQLADQGNLKDHKYVYLDCSGSTVTSIVEGAFQQCYSLTGVTLGNSVTSIKQAAFQGCTNLTSVIIGSGVTSIWVLRL